MTKYFYTIVCACLLSVFFVQHGYSASRYMGGEITWECTPQGNFRFILKVYQDCAGSSFPEQVNLISNAPGFDTIPLYLVSSTDVSPPCSCPGGPVIDCPGTPTGSTHLNSGAILEYVYTTDSLFPAGVPLVGVPPATGWYFSYTDCCRVPSQNLQNTSTSPWYLQSVMYPFHGTPVNTCFDHSPHFLEKPAMVICKDNPFSYNPLGFDKEQDSLVFLWTHAYGGDTSIPLTSFFGGYSVTSPLPGPMHNPNNVAVSMDPETGVSSFLSFNHGSFLAAVKVKAYKQGELVAEIHRDMQVILLNCGFYALPDIIPPFMDTAGQHTLFHTSVYAGQAVQFSLELANFNHCPNSFPPQWQDLTLHVFGEQLDAPMNPGGCATPPCATLTPAVPLVGSLQVQANFAWQTDTHHVAYSPLGVPMAKTYRFHVMAVGGFCPAPSVRNEIVTIQVVPYPEIHSPPIRCAEVLYNGDVLLTWDRADDHFDLFESYHLWSSDSPNGPFSKIDSVTDINTTSFLHQGADALDKAVYYLLTVRGTHTMTMEQPVDTFRTICLNVAIPGSVGNPYSLHWNHPIPTQFDIGDRIYKVYRRDQGQTWMKMGSATGSEFHSFASLPDDTVAFKVVLTDTSNVNACESVSNELVLYQHIGVHETAMERFQLYQNIPNPATGLTLIPFAVPEAGRVELSIRHLTGQTVLQQEMQAMPGKHHFALHIDALPQGVYLYTVQFQGAQQTRKMTIGSNR